MRAVGAERHVEHVEDGDEIKLAVKMREQRALFLVEIDADELGDALRWELSRNDELFPHLYGVLDIGAVISVTNLSMRSDGYHDIPELAP